MAVALITQWLACQETAVGPSKCLAMNLLKVLLKQKVLLEQKVLLKQRVYLAIFLGLLYPLSKCRLVRVLGYWVLLAAYSDPDPWPYRHFRITWLDNLGKNIPAKFVGTNRPQICLAKESYKRIYRNLIHCTPGFLYKLCFIFKHLATI